MKTKGPLILLLLVGMLTSLPSGAQIRCVTEQVEQIRRGDKGVPSIAQFERWMEGRLEEKKSRVELYGTGETNAEPLVIPVVVHILHKGEAVGQGTNLSDAQIISQVEVLNEDFQRLNADTVLTRNAWLPMAGKLNVEFVLAKRDPDGMATNGIVRKQGSRDQWSPFRRDLIAAESYWPAEDYLNVWVTDLTNSYLGMAQYPDIDLPGLEDEDKDNRLTDGVYISYKVFGSATKDPNARLSAKYDLGRTCTHEIGHYLGLRHVWGDDLFDCAVDDYVQDTPASTENYAGICPVSSATCGSEDMYENYLYYTADACMNIFTAQQVERMQVVLENAPRRASLATSTGAIPPDGSFADLAISGVLNPGVVVCSEETDYVLRVRNSGTIDVSGFRLDYQLDGTGGSQIFYDEVIAPGNDLEVTIPSVFASGGSHVLSATVSLVGDGPDVDLGNNSIEKAFITDGSEDFVPIRQDFEHGALPAQGWSVLNEDGLVTWEIAETEGLRPDNQSAAIMLYDYASLYEEDWLISPALDFTHAEAASLSFRASYARSIGRDDRLRVRVSDDCGRSFRETVLDLSSVQLGEQISENYWMPQSRSDWQDFSVDLSQYAGMPDVRIAFVAFNSGGNNLYLDDIEIYTTAEDKVLSLAENNFVLHPNPAVNGTVKLTLYTATREDLNVVVYDAQGRALFTEVLHNALNQTYEINLGARPRGVYLVRLAGSDFVRTKKLVIGRR